MSRLLAACVVAFVLGVALGYVNGAADEARELQRYRYPLGDA